jgi:hypothetical protein
MDADTQPRDALGRFIDAEAVGDGGSHDHAHRDGDAVPGDPDASKAAISDDGDGEAIEYRLVSWGTFIAGEEADTHDDTDQIDPGGGSVSGRLAGGTDTWYLSPPAAGVVHAEFGGEPPDEQATVTVNGTDVEPPSRPHRLAFNALEAEPGAGKLQWTAFFAPGSSVAWTAEGPATVDPESDDAIIERENGTIVASGAALRGVDALRYSGHVTNVQLRGQVEPCTVHHDGTEVTDDLRSIYSEPHPDSGWGDAWGSGWDGEVPEGVETVGDALAAFGIGLDTPIDRAAMLVASQADSTDGDENESE